MTRTTTKAGQLRADFLRVLAGWAKRMGYGKDVLLAMGVAEEELVQTGIS